MSDFTVTIVEEVAQIVTVTEEITQIVTINQGVTGAAGQTGAAGSAGAAGAAGATGPAGPPIVEVNAYGSPTALANSAQITAPVNQREKRYIKGNAAPVTGITIAVGSGTQELYLYGVDGTNTAQLVSSANVQLVGTWVAGLGSMITLHWTQGLNKWTEAHRNEL